MPQEHPMRRLHMPDTHDEAEAESRIVRFDERTRVSTERVESKTTAKAPNAEEQAANSTQKSTASAEAQNTEAHLQANIPAAHLELVASEPIDQQFTSGSQSAKPSHSHEEHSEVPQQWYVPPVQLKYQFTHQDDKQRSESQSDASKVVGYIFLH